MSSIHPHPSPLSTPTTTGRGEGAKRVRLVAECGPCHGQVFVVQDERCFIGRDPNCQVRPASTEIAGVHAVIEQIKDVLFLRDLDTALGTAINGEVLRDTKKEIFHGDEIRIGPLVLRVSVGSDWSGRDLPSVPEGWPFIDPASSFFSAIEPGAPAYPSGEQRGPKGSLTYEVVEGVVKVTPLSPEFDDEVTVAPLRYDLQHLLDEPLPRREVIDLGAVRYLSSRGVGVLLAHFQGLARLGGVLRVARVNPTKVLPVLKQMKLEMFIDLYPDADQAIHDPWE